MIICGNSFLFCVLTLYTFYRHILQPNEYIEQVSTIHFMWIMFYMTMILTVIYYGSLIAREVLNETNRMKFYPFILNIPCHFQGKRTSEVVHDIINRCHDSEIVQSVRKLNSKFQKKKLSNEITFIV